MSDMFRLQTEISFGADEVRPRSERRSHHALSERARSPSRYSRRVLAGTLGMMHLWWCGRFGQRLSQSRYSRRAIACTLGVS